jgi:hypothetical protein
VKPNQIEENKLNTYNLKTKRENVLIDFYNTIINNGPKYPYNYLLY